MKRKPKYVFNVTNYFENDLRQFTSEEQELITKQINYFTEQFDNNPSNFDSFIDQSHILITPRIKYTPTVHILRIKADIRLFATFDNYPIFNQIIVTLLGCLHHHEDYSKKVNDFYEFLYDSEGIVMKSEEDNDSN